MPEYKLDQNVLDQLERSKIQAKLGDDDKIMPERYNNYAEELQDQIIRDTIDGKREGKQKKFLESDDFLKTMEEDVFQDRRRADIKNSSMSELDATKEVEN